jgi:magnesium transporter
MEEDTDDVKYLKIVYDDINQLIEMIQSYQGTINSTRDTFSNSISLQTNDVMRILTIFSTIVLPLSLLTNVLDIEGFDLNKLNDLPKYFSFLVIMIVLVTGISLAIFWKKDGYSIKKRQLLMIKILTIINSKTIGNYI